MAKVLFINPVIREEDDPRHVPYGIALLASILMREGHLVQVFDANAWRASDHVLAQVLTADRWDVVALGGITTAYRSIRHIVGQEFFDAAGFVNANCEHDCRLLFYRGLRG